MTDQDDVYAAFAASHPDGQLYAAGRPGARYLISITPTISTFMVDGEPDTRDFMEVFQKVRQANVFSGKVSVLVDLIRFTGGVDWAAIKAAHDMTDWATVDFLHVAYLVRDSQFAPLAKIAGVIFSESLNRVFEDRDAAVAWLTEMHR